MDALQAIILGIVQGLTEWLPISSKAQVTAVGIVFGIDPKVAFGYAILLHIGTLLAAIIVLWPEIKELFEQKHKPLSKFLLIALLVTPITALPSYLFFRENFLFSSFVIFALIGVMLIITGLIQGWVKRVWQSNFSNKNAAILGLAQGITAFPGLSRSGTTVSVLLFEGFSPEEAFRISFLLSIPSVFFAEIGFGIIEGVSFEPNLLFGIIASFIVGLISMKFLLKIAHRINFSKFCIVFGIFYLILAFLI
ncbi:MAG: undecaprenyl-diphosphate phosphatase [archaeon]|nr:undecaprenyl-diphosphate phosphatase [archaeon]